MNAENRIGALLGSARGGLRRERLVDYVFMAAFLLILVAAALSSDVFFTERNLVNISRQMVTNGLISVGMLMVILSGGIDLSVGAVVAMAGIMAAGFQASMPWWAAVILALGIGVAAGATNGYMIARFRLEPFIVTLATLSAYRGLVYVYSNTPVTPSEPGFRSALGGGYVGPVPIPVLVMLAVYVIAWLFLNRTVPGRVITAIGGNKEAVRLAGFNVRRHTVLAYAISGFTAALAGILLVSRLGIAQPNLGVAYELDAIAATVIGGAILGGGGGSIVGALGGVAMLGVIDNLLNLLNVQSYYQQVIKGLLILAAVLARRRDASR